jgi:hypothetical protein
MSVDRFLAVGGLFHGSINLPPAVPRVSPLEALWGSKQKASGGIENSAGGFKRIMENNLLSSDSPLVNAALELKRASHPEILLLFKERKICYSI